MQYDKFVGKEIVLCYNDYIKPYWPGDRTCKYTDRVLVIKNDKENKLFLLRI